MNTEYQSLVESQYSGRISKADSDDSSPINAPLHDASGGSNQLNGKLHNSDLNSDLNFDQNPNQNNASKFNSNPQNSNFPLQNSPHTTNFTSNIHRSNSNSTLSDNSSTQNFIHEANTRSTKAKQWHHVRDLDSFFKSVYDYHQGHGFFNITLKLALELFQFIFTVFFVTILTCCVDYESIFKNKYNGTETDSTGLPIVPDDWHRPWSIVWDSNCKNNILNSSFTFHVFLIAAGAVFLIRLVRSISNFLNFIQIRNFYNEALSITSIENFTWYEVQAKVLQVQKDVQLCIHKNELTELDVYNRILRFKNYMVALANKNLLPSITLPVLGKTQFLSHSLKFNYQLIFFNSPFSIFENNFKIRDEYKVKKDRRLLASHLSRTITVLAVLNLVFAPFILMWQLIYSFFTYVEMAKREPDVFGKRRWTEFTRLKLRHFNELEHEFNARLARAYRPGTKYFNCFPNHTLIIIAENFSFIFGALLAVLIVLTVFDEDVLKIEHALTLVGALTAVVGILRAMIPADDALFCPEELLKTVLTHVHYLPAGWKNKAHTSEVQASFDKMFQLRAIYILEELLSPFLIPYILFFKLRPKSLEIVDFFRCFTINIDGVGDVCSFAMMDLLRHGDPMWNQSKFSINRKLGSVLDEDEGENNLNSQTTKNSSSGSGLAPGTTYDIADEGKTEKSLLHFKALNPGWVINDQQVKHWVESNLYRRKQDVGPEIAEMLSSQATYKYLSVTKRSMGASSRVMPIDSQQLFGMNASILKLQDSYGDRERDITIPHDSPSTNIIPTVSSPRRPFEYQENTATNRFEMSSVSFRGDTR